LLDIIVLLIHNEFEEKQKEEHTMLSDNIKNLRKNKGFTQEELANKLNVVRHGPVIIGLN